MPPVWLFQNLSTFVREDPFFFYNGSLKGPFSDFWEHCISVFNFIDKIFIYSCNSKELRLVSSVEKRKIAYTAMSSHRDSTTKFICSTNSWNICNNQKYNEVLYIILWPFPYTIIFMVSVITQVCFPTFRQQHRKISTHDQSNSSWRLY